MFAENLKMIMARERISGAVLARETGYSKAAISQYVNGINVPSRERVEAIAAVLGVAVGELTAVPVREPAAPPCKCTVQQKATLTPREAAGLMHVHESYIRDGLKYARPGFEFGTAVPPSKKHTKWRYKIYANKFTEITGIQVNV